MPTLWAHTQYFATTSTVVPAPLAASDGGYPRWQASNIAVGSLFGGLQTLWERIVWWVGLWKRRTEIEQALERYKNPPKPGVIYKPVERIVQAKPQIIRETVVERVPTPLSGVLERVEALRQHPAYPCALEAVQKTATTLGFNRPEAWQGLSRHMKSSAGRAENVFRHLEACRLTREASPSTLTNPDCNLLVELAYHEWSRR
jgi:hypothetical protein